MASVTYSWYSIGQSMSHGQTHSQWGRDVSSSLSLCSHITWQKMGIYNVITKKQRIVQKNQPQCIRGRKDISKNELYGAKIIKTLPHSPISLQEKCHCGLGPVLTLANLDWQIWFLPAVNGFRGTSFMLSFVHSLSKDFNISFCARHRGNWDKLHKRVLWIPAVKLLVYN